MAAGSLPRSDLKSRRLGRVLRSVAYIFGQFMLPEPLPGLGVVGDAPVDGEVLVEGDALVDGPTSGDALGDGDVAACTAIVPNPPAMPTPAATTILATGPRIQPRLSKLITSLAAMRWPIATGSSMSTVAFQFHYEFVRTSL